MSLENRNKKIKKLEQAHLEAGWGGSGWQEVGRQTCSQARAEQTALSSSSYQQRANFNTASTQRSYRQIRCWDWRSCFKSCTLAGRHTNKDRRTGWWGSRGSGRQLAAARAGLVLLTTRLTDGSRVFGAGSTPLLVKRMLQVPSCEESRANKLMDDHSRDTESVCRVSICVRKETVLETAEREEMDRKEKTAFPPGIIFLAFLFVSKPEFSPKLNPTPKSAK